MTGRILLVTGLAITAISAPVSAVSVGFDDSRVVSGGGSSMLPPYLQCVPYARQVSGIMIFGDAHTWWEQAAGRYSRGTMPRVGAVMAFKPHGNSTLGHVAAVSRIIDSRTILIRHANWSPINGRRGQIEDDVRAIDVSEDNDWSEVRVWYAPIQALGGTHWPVQGFIYKGKPPKGERPILTSPLTFAKSDKPAARSADPIGDLISARLGI